LEKIKEILIGNLSLGSPNDRLAFLIDKINEVIKPPRQASAENVNIRAMYVVNELINSHGGQFRPEEMSKLCTLIADTPVLIGHNRAGSPLARTFYAELEEKENILWLKSYFYWPKSEAGQSDDLLLKIDSGVLKECSISFTYTFPECSVCGEDIRKCPHELSLNPSESNQAHFIYNGITQVLETSLVYKGSVRGTYITDKLSVLENALVIETGLTKQVIPIPDALETSIAKIIPLETKRDFPKVKYCPPEIIFSIAQFGGRHFMVIKSA
jgi:hypothetical protein